MAQYDFHYLPLEGKITGKQVLQQTEDAINDLGNRITDIETDTEAITEAVEIAQDAKNTADNAETIANDAMDVAQAERESAQEAAQEANQAATNAANSASSASVTAQQLMEYLETKEEITAPAVDPTLTISGAAADANITGGEVNKTKDNLTVLSGKAIPHFEIGNITFGTGGFIFRPTYTNGIYTPQGNGIPIVSGTKISLSNTSDYKYKYGVDKGDGTYIYSNYRTADATINVDGTLYLVIAKSDESEVTSVYPLGNVVTVLLPNSVVNDVNANTKNISLQIGELESVKNAVATSSGNIVPYFEIGGYGLGSSTIIFNPNYTGSIYIPQGRGIPVTANTKISLSDYTNYKFRISVDKGDGSYEFTSSYLITDYYTKNGGILYVQIAKADDSTVTSVYPMGNIVTIECPDSTINSLEQKAGYGCILENKHFPVEWFGVGTFYVKYYNPNLRIYRASTKKGIVFPYDVTLSPESGYRFDIFKVIDGVWTEVGWQTGEYAIPAGTTFGVIIAKVTEDTSSTADVPTFVSKLNVVTQLRQIIEAGEYDPSDTDAINSKIETYMSLFYASNNADFYTFFTDPHLMGTDGTFNKTTFKTYMDTIKGVFGKISANHVICGGDWLNSGDTKAQASAKLGYVDGKMREYFGDNYYPVVGNHDFNYLGVDSGGTRLPSNEWVQSSAMHNFWFSRFEHCYYTFKRNNARKYILNTMQDYDSVVSYLQEQWDWFASELITNDDAHSVIVMHIFYLAGQGSTIPKKTHAIGQIVQAYNAHTTCTLTSADDGYDKTYDFNGTTGHIDYILVGHSHQDFTLTYGGVPVIATLNTQNGGVPSFDLVFTDYDNNKVHLIRIGTGSDREITF